MKPLLLFFALLYFASCSTTEQITGLTPPELLIKYPLPAFPERLITPHFKIDMEIQVAEDGSVRNIRLLNSSGNLVWDSVVTAAIRQWRYSPARYNGQPVKIWLHQTVAVQFSEPLYLSLAEILCNTTEEADSAYGLLERGTDFAEVVLRYSVAPSRETNGSIGEVNIQRYPEYIQRILTKLDIEECSQPVRYGDGYVIFKRVKRERPELLP